MNIKLLQHAGLTEGESKVYLALLELGSTTTGPIIEKSGVARSFIYNLLNNLTEKGLVSHLSIGGKTLYQAANPERIINYLEKKRIELEEDQKQVTKILPMLKSIQQEKQRTNIEVFEGFRGLQTVFEKYKDKLKAGDEMLTLGVPPTQEDKYHDYWQEFHKERVARKITNKILFNKGTKKQIIDNRNSFKGCQAKIMDSDIETPAWILIYQNITTIFLQDKKGPLSIEIENEEIAKTFKAYFEDYWKQAK
ncbi:MAG: helix-turn-helix domain-containing protein [Candidatus Woesearchaeota archaeon]|jgi:sugar-specific transcriptional regulator TrmB